MSRRATAGEGTRAFLNHVSIAIGSQAEVATCIELALRLGFVRPDQRAQLLARSDAVGRLLYGLYRALASKVTNP